ncbi:hypothetical protein HDU93_001705, partial [Gonapodya sp. JEL0774]
MAPMVTRLTDLPTEILLRIGQCLPHRLGFPSGALNKRLSAIFRTPSNIAIRAIAHHKSCARALVRESSRYEHDQNLVVEAIYQKGISGSPSFHVNEIVDNHRGPARNALIASVETGNIKVVATLLKL